MKRILSFVLAVLFGLFATHLFKAENLSVSGQKILSGKIGQFANESVFSEEIDKKVSTSLCSVESPEYRFAGIFPEQIISQPKLSYTETARQNRIQGRVNLQVTFQDNGKIGRINVIKGLSSGLTEEAISVVKQIKFKPYLAHGISRTVSRKVECNFILQ